MIMVALVMVKDIFHEHISNDFDDPLPVSPLPNAYN